MNRNSIHDNPDGCVLFIDMNSFFATCEQQVNYWLRNRPVCVCVYTGKHGIIIAPSVEAKALGIRLGMRLSEAMKICPDIVPLETNPQRYRKFHIRVMNVLKKYSDDVIPKSIDEAIVDLSDYALVYKNTIQLAQQIKQDIREKVGDWMKCSIGIAPNAFLAKLGSNLKKPDGLEVITKASIDSVLEKLTLTDLPGISYAMANRFQRGGIRTPLELRHASPFTLKKACNSIVGIHWHYRLNFREVDQQYTSYKSMQARRAISWKLRQSVEDLHDLFRGLCLKLEKRMVKENVFCHQIGFFSSYENGTTWKDVFKTDSPTQDGIEIMNRIQQHMKAFQETRHSEPIINRHIKSMGVSVGHFIPDEAVQLHLFENNVRKNNLRKLVYDVKDKYGNDKLVRAIELRDEAIIHDAIGFGSVKDLHYKGKEA